MAVRAASGLTVSEVKTEIMCLHVKRMPESTAIFSVEEAGHVYNSTNEFFYTSRGTPTTMPTCSSRWTGVYAAHGDAFGNTPSKCTTDRALPSSSNYGCQEPRYSRQSCRTASHRARVRSTMTRCAEPTTAS